MQTERFLNCAGDYVYLTDESGGSARKLRNPFNGPYVVDLVLSPHLVQLRDPSNDKVLPQPIHLESKSHM